MKKNALYEISRLTVWASESERIRWLRKDQLATLRQLEADEQAAVVTLLNATSEEKKSARTLLRAAVQKVAEFRAKFGLDPECSLA